MINNNAEMSSASLGMSSSSLGMSSSSLGMSSSSSTYISTPLGFYRHRNLPHFDSLGVYQMITYRLADSLPAAKLEQLRTELTLNTLPIQTTALEIKKRRLIEQYLDAGYGSCVLKNPDCANIVINAWTFFDKKHYDLIAWVVMPNHVHVLIQPYQDYSLGKIIQSWKSYTGRRILLICRAGARHSQAGARHSQACARHSQACARHSQLETQYFQKRHTSLWQREYWDRYVRNANHFSACINYIHNNPVKAGLVAEAADWPWSSARSTA